MEREPVVLDTDTLSELSRGNPIVKGRALAKASGVDLRPVDWSRAA